MPIYEYRCTACGFQKEYLQKISDAPPTDCPECGKASLTKMVTAAGFQLKGSGWYATDFKHGPRPASKPEDKPAVKSEDQPAAKADDKTASKPEVKPAPEAPSKKSDAATSTAASGTGTNPVSS